MLEAAALIISSENYEWPDWPIMHSPRLCEVKDRNTQQALIGSGKREFRPSHNQASSGS
jgi:hypothetical protein